jgi:hypothetical protein
MCGYLDLKSLDLVLKGTDLAHEVGSLVGGDGAGDHSARNAAGSSEGHLGGTKVLLAQTGPLGRKGAGDVISDKIASICEGSCPKVHRLAQCKWRKRTRKRMAHSIFLISTLIDLRLWTFTCLVFAQKWEMEQNR